MKETGLSTLGSGRSKTSQHHPDRRGPPLRAHYDDYAPKLCFEKFELTTQTAARDAVPFRVHDSYQAMELPDPPGRNKAHSTNVEMHRWQALRTPRTGGRSG